MGKIGTIYVPIHEVPTTSHSKAKFGAIYSASETKKSTFERITRLTNGFCFKNKHIVK